MSICPLNSEDSANLHLIAITQSGVRLYFSTINVLDNVVYPPGTPTSSPMTYEVVRPQSLYLLHVRLPPGYATVGKPKNIHSAYYCNGTLLMVSTPQPDQDLLWSLSSEPFSVRPYLAESCTRIELNGQVWGIAEMQDSNSHGSLVNPLKKARTNKQIVLLTNQGAHIIALAKPMGLLKQLLVSCHGPHHDAVKSYFLNQNEQQTCAVSLLIACSEAFRGTEIGMWATQALILYGGEPQFYQPDPQMMVSTPFASRHSPNFFQQQQQQLQQHQQFPLSPSNSISLSTHILKIMFNIYLFQSPIKIYGGSNRPNCGNPSNIFSIRWRTSHFLPNTVESIYILVVYCDRCGKRSALYNHVNHLSRPTIVVRYWKSFIR